MGQTSRLIEWLKKCWKLFRVPFLDGAVKKLLIILIDLSAALLGWHFPQKFLWDWKLEMLLKKHEEDTVAVFRQLLKPGMTVVDIGAHIGYYTRLFSTLVGPKGRVYAFEADDENFSLLEQNTRGRRNVCLVKNALTDHDGTVTFYKIHHSTGCHSTLPPDVPSEALTVPAARLDTFLRDHNISRVDAIKIDIEGGEPFAFAGMQALFNQQAPLIIISEFLPSSFAKQNRDPEAFLRYIEGFGFALYEIGRKGGLKNITSKSLKSLSLYKTGYTNLLYAKGYPSLMSA